MREGDGWMGSWVAGRPEMRISRKCIHHLFNSGPAWAMVHGQKQCIHIKEALLYVFPCVLHALAWVSVIIRGIGNYRNM